MKIAFICSDRSLAVFGNSGRSSFIREELRAIARRVEQVQLFAARLDGDRPSGLENLRIHKLSSFGSDPSRNETAVPAANKELRRMLDSARGSAFDGLFERFSPWCHAGVEYCRSNGIPAVLEVSESAWEDLQKLPNEAQQKALQTLRDATLILAGSEGVAQALEAQGITATLIPGGIDPDSYSTGAKLTIQKSNLFTIGYLGALDSWDELLPPVEAFAGMHKHHPETRLLIEGEGSAKAPMITELSRRGLLGTACFLGHVSLRRIPGVLSALDVALVPGLSAQATRIREIMLAGVPLISCAGDIPEVRHNINALQCAPSDSAALLQALRTLHGDRILRMRLGSNARRAVFREETWDMIASAILRPLKPEEPTSLSVSLSVAAAPVPQTAL